MAIFRVSLTGIILTAAFTVTLLAQNSANLKTTPGFDLSAIDKSANPCDNFYQYACGTWLKNNPIPSDQAAWGRFSELAERNREIEHQILERAAANPGSEPDHQRIGNYYASCMDEKTINSKGLASIQPELNRIRAIQNAQ